MGRRRIVWAALTVGVLIGIGYSVSVLRDFDRRDAHLPAIDENDEFAVGLRRAHKDLNSAVGWDDWRPTYLRKTAPRLRKLAAKYPNAASPLTDAAVHIERALKENDRRAAVVAHRAVAGLEALHRQNTSRRTDSPQEAGGHGHGRHAPAGS